MLEDANGDSSVLLSVEEHISVSLNIVTAVRVILICDKIW